MEKALLPYEINYFYTWWEENGSYMDYDEYSIDENWNDVEKPCSIIVCNDKISFILLDEYRDCPEDIGEYDTYNGQENILERDSVSINPITGEISGQGFDNFIFLSISDVIRNKELIKENLKKIIVEYNS